MVPVVCHSFLAMTEESSKFHDLEKLMTMPKNNQAQIMIIHWMTDIRIPLLVSSCPDFSLHNYYFNLSHGTLFMYLRKYLRKREQQQIINTKCTLPPLLIISKNSHLSAVYMWAKKDNFHFSNKTGGENINSAYFFIVSLIQKSKQLYVYILSLQHLFKKYNVAPICIKKRIELCQYKNDRVH